MSATHSIATAVSTALATVGPQANGRVAVDEHAGEVCRIETREALDDHVAGLPFVGAGDLGRPSSCG